MPEPRHYTKEGHYPLANVKIPRGWVRALVGDLCLAVHPGSANGNYNRAGIGIPHLRPMNISRDGALDLSDLRYVEDDGAKRLKRGDVLFNNTNSEELVGKTCWIDSDREFAFSNHMTRLSLGEGVSAPFVARQLHFLWMTGYSRHCCTHHVNQASISSKTLAQTIPLLVPPMHEQERIGGKLDELLARVTAGEVAARRALVRLQRYREAVLYAAVTGELTRVWRKTQKSSQTGAQVLKRLLLERRTRWEEATIKRLKSAGRLPKNDKWRSRYPEPTAPAIADLPSIPKGWKWASLEMIAELGSGVSVSQNRLVENPVEVPYLRVANVLRGSLDLSEVKTIRMDRSRLDSYLLKAGDILFNEGGDRDKLGRGWLWEGQIPKCVHQNHVFRARLINRELIDARLVSHWGNTFGQQFFISHGTQSTNLASINRSVLARLPVPIAPVEEQHAIVQQVESRLASADRLTATLHRQLDHATNTRQSLLREAFAGKLVPQNPEDEPAAILLDRIRAAREAEAMKPKQKRIPKPKLTPADTVDQLEVLIKKLGSSATAERLLLAAGLGDDVEKFFDLLREGRDQRRLLVPIGKNTSIRKVRRAN